MRNDDGIFLFKFATKTGLEQVLERGLWMIRNSPIILNKWIPYVSLTRNEVTKVPVWIKLHKIPLVAYSEDGLSLIATKIGKPIMLDAFTSSMCRGCIGYARALVEINADIELKMKVIMVVPIEDGEGYTQEVISMEYEWKPPHCIECKTFGHSLNTCPKNVNKSDPIATTADVQSDGFTEVSNRKNKGRKADQQPKSKHIRGIRLNKPKPSFYRPKTVTENTHGNAVKSKSKDVGEASTSNTNGVNPSMKNSVTTHIFSNAPGHYSAATHFEGVTNSFEVLNSLDGDDDVASMPSLSRGDQGYESDENEVYVSSIGGGHDMEEK
ncbi:reverse transcriptase domain-containing protein [Tanacetum coccineum]|uniref:Reverse transcriptase domain-containing protein n=1 Tax=Tanacetum coccineum TaxID=301880 RepID=A0ABQ5H4U7_9ASTR